MNQALKVSASVSVEDYLEREKYCEIRHEFVNGEVFSMAGESKFHNLIVGNLYVALRRHLRDKPSCRVFMESVKTQVRSDQEVRYFYPDLQVSCESSALSEYYESAPKLVIEVLSPSTERFDRADKFYAYRKLPSLEEYVLVAQDTPRVEVYRLVNQWELELYTEMSMVVALDSVGFSLKLINIYEDIVFDESNN